MQRNSASQLISGDTHSWPFQATAQGFSEAWVFVGKQAQAHFFTDVPAQWLKPAAFFLSTATLLLFIPGHGK